MPVVGADVDDQSILLYFGSLVMILIDISRPFPNKIPSIQKNIPFQSERSLSRTIMFLQGRHDFHSQKPPISHRRDVTFFQEKYSQYQQQSHRHLGV